MGPTGGFLWVVMLGLRGFMEISWGPGCEREPAVTQAVIPRLLQEGYGLQSPQSRKDSSLEPLEAKLPALYLQCGDRSLDFSVRSGAVEIRQSLPRGGTSQSAVILELIHKILSGLYELGASAMPSSRAPRIAVDMGETPLSQAMAKVLRQALTEVLRHDVWILGRGEQVDHRLCLATQSSGYLLWRTAGESCDGPSPRAVAASTFAEVKHWIAEELRAISSAVAKPVAPAVLEPSVPCPVCSVQPTPARAKPYDRIHVSASAGAAFRLRSVDAAVGLRVAAFPHRLFGLVAEAVLMPSSVADLQILDTRIGMGPMARVLFGRRWSLTFGVTAGALIHRYKFAGNGAGNQIDATIAVPLTLGVNLHRRLAVVFGVQGALGSNSRRHKINGETVWSRSAFSITTEIGLRGQWGPS